MIVIAPYYTHAGQAKLTRPTLPSPELSRQQAKQFLCTLRALTVVVLAAGAAFPLEDVVVDSGSIAGSKYVIAVPREPSGKLLMFAHGLRTQDAPLSAAVDLSSPMNKALLADGWIVASASFRRNGWIVDEAMEDLDNLYTYIAITFGEPDQTLVMGNTMGGHIVVRMAERERTKDRPYDGFVSVCAALGVDEDMRAASSLREYVGSDGWA